MNFLTLGKENQNFATGTINVNIEHSEKATKKFLGNDFTITIVSMATVESMIEIL